MAQPQSVPRLRLNLLTSAERIHRYTSLGRIVFYVRGPQGRAEFIVEHGADAFDSIRKVSPRQFLAAGRNA